MARRVLSPADRMLRDQFKLTGWVQKPPTRRQEYFKWCDQVLEKLRTLTEEEEPSADQAVVTCVQAMLLEDGTFIEHAAKNRGSSLLAEDEGWEKIAHAAGAQVFHEYLVAVEKGNWPEEEGRK